jgi:hypothetical protein
MSDSLKILLGALGGAVLALLLVSVLGGGGMMGGGLFRMQYSGGHRIVVRESQTRAEGSAPPASGSAGSTAEPAPRGG